MRILALPVIVTLLALIPAVAIAQDAPPPAGKTYTNSKHGFSIRLPEGWVPKGKTATMKPSAPGNG